MLLKPECYRIPVCLDLKIPLELLEHSSKSLDQLLLHLQFIQQIADNLCFYLSFHIRIVNP